MQNPFFRSAPRHILRPIMFSTVFLAGYAFAMMGATTGATYADTRDAAVPSVPSASAEAKAQAPIKSPRGLIEAFLDTTGFDVALESIAYSADGAPAMIGLDARNFGGAWDLLAGEVFDQGAMRDMAVDMLQKTLSHDALRHASAFYSSDLGQKLVRAENASHDIQDGAVTLEAGSLIVSQMVKAGDPKIDVFRRMSAAISTEDDSIRAIQEVQMRFLIAAESAGIVQLNLGTDALADLLQGQEGALRLSLQEGALASSAYTYQGFSLEELNAYVDALEHPLMQEVYRLLNAVQYEIQANRYEALAFRLKDLAPNTDL